MSGKYCESSIVQHEAVRAAGFLECSLNEVFRLQYKELYD